jgi:hypothetical protein
MIGKSMSEEKKTDDTGGNPDDSGGSVTFGAIRQMIEDAISKLGGGTKTDTPKTDTTVETGPQSRQSLAGEVERELRKMQAKEKEDQEKTGVADRLTALEEKVVEKAPVERSRVHRLMGWGEPDAK